LKQLQNENDLSLYTIKKHEDELGKWKVKYDWLNGEVKEYEI